MRRTFVGPAIVIVLGVATTSCTAEGGEGAPEAALIQAGSWTLTSLEMQDFSRTPDVESATPHLGLTAEAVEGLDGWYRLTGSAGCNEMSGRYRLGTEGAFGLSLEMTERGCRPEIMEFEMLFASTLDRVRTYEIEGSTLVLGGPMGTLRFTRDGGDPGR